MVDTYRRCNSGGENDTDESAAFVRACDRLRVEFGCSTLVIHHTGNEHPDRERGSSVLRDAADTRIRFKLEDADQRIVRVICAKQKDDARFDDMVFRLQPYHDSLVVTQGEQLPAHQPFASTDAKPNEMAAWVRTQPGQTVGPKQLCDRYGISESALRSRRKALAAHGCRYLRPQVNGGRSAYTTADPAPPHTSGVPAGSDPEPHTPTGGSTKTHRGGVGGGTPKGSTNPQPIPGQMTVEEVLNELVASGEAEWEQGSR